MNLYSIVLFFHIVGAVGFFVALGLEWTSLRRLRRSTTAEEVREWLRVPDDLGRIGMISMVLLLVAGFYMMFVAWGGAPWITVTLGTIVVLIVLSGGITRRRMVAIGKAAGAERGPLSSTLKRLVNDPALWFSMQTRIAIAVGILFLMTNKPGLVGSLITIAVATAAGILVSLPSPRREAVHEEQAR